jgi:hypothetical protein
MYGFITVIDQKIRTINQTARTIGEISTGKHGIFLPHIRDEKFTYPKPATSRLTGDQ